MKQIANIKHSWFNPLHKTVTRYNQAWTNVNSDHIRFIGGVIRVYLYDRYAIGRTTFRKDGMRAYMGSEETMEEISFSRAGGRNVGGNTILATGDLTYLEVAGVVLVDKR